MLLKHPMEVGRKLKSGQTGASAFYLYVNV